MANISDNGQPHCGLCRRAVPRVSRHHLVPRSRAKKRKRRGQYPRNGEMKADIHTTVDLCSACHKMIHAVLTEKQLENEYNSIDALRAHPEIARFLNWVVKQPPDRGVTVRWTRGRREQHQARK